MDIDLIMTGKPKSVRDKMQVVLGADEDGERDRRSRETSAYD
jgi:hypothetical protein